MKKRIIISILLLLTVLVSCETLLFKSQPVDTEVVLSSSSLDDTKPQESQSSDISSEAKLSTPSTLSPTSQLSRTPKSADIPPIKTPGPEERYFGTWTYTNKNYRASGGSLIFNDYDWPVGSSVSLSFTFMEGGFGIKETTVTYRGVMREKRDAFIWALENQSADFIRVVVIDDSADNYRFKYDGPTMLSINHVYAGSFYFVNYQDDSSKSMSE